MGDGYGPRLVSTRARPADPRAGLRGLRVAVPGLLTTAYLALKLYQPEVEHVVVPFDRIEDAVHRGEVDVGLLIHEGQLTYERRGLERVVDLGEWWLLETGLPLPLGINVARRDLGSEVLPELSDVLRDSIRAGLANRDEALSYALQYGRGLTTELADQFVGMYVNELTEDYGEEGRQAVAELLRRGEEAGAFERPVRVEFVN